ncbi:Glycine receptor subunit alphaZ1 [Portunus trituberculatus]|uniref:Glycine receptor subunit alphaZ1 n=1 Tax=Portunus trituberculatus TaxID=210409 RepID=A0A5B7G1K2_PORTR|nr:Glycine receptor subunit alphaZ1 [Portunus trituberculatus]
MESTDTEILDFLLHKSRYDKRIRPPDKDGPVRVNVSVLLLSLSSPDESSLNYEVEFLLNQQWQDPRLKHDDNGRYDYLSGMHHLVSHEGRCGDVMWCSGHECNVAGCGWE